MLPKSNVSSGTKHFFELEREMKMENNPRHVSRIAIKATPDQVWQAITDPAKTSKFWHHCAFRSDWQIESPFELWNGEEKRAEGIILDIDPPSKLVMSWRYVAFPGAKHEPPIRITWEIGSHEDLMGVTLVTVVHDELDQAAETAKIVERGFPIVLSGLKTLLETGEALVGG